jgi:hypothetical protein
MLKIERAMDVHAVMERMGNQATYPEAVAMIEFLLVGDYTHTDEIPECEWLELCAMSVEGVARNSELGKGHA